MRARVRQIGRSATWLVGRLLAVSLAAAGKGADLSVVRPAPEPAPWTMPAELLPAGRDAAPAELLRRLRTDRGCVGPVPRRHLACGAARELVRRGARGAPVLAALEESVTAAGRPACVREAAVEALAEWGGPESRRALARMRSVLRRRLAWDGAGDRSLARRIDEVLGGQA